MKRLVLPLAVIVIAGAGIWAFVAKRGGPAAPRAGEPRAAASPSDGMGGREAFAKFRESHKYTFMLTRMATGIGQLETEGSAPLTSAQAKAILTVLNPIRKQTSLSQDEAKEAVKKLKAVLTAKQLTEIARMKQPERRFHSPTEGERRPRQGPRFDTSAMGNFNPFNPQKGNPMAARSANRIEALFDALNKKAAGK